MSPFDLRQPNALAFARLILAVLVIVSHSPELIDGNPDREFLKRCFGTLTTGQVAVHGFFFISGFLIVDSAVRRAPPTRNSKTRSPPLPGPSRLLPHRIPRRAPR